jgi:hypothetical protein
MPECKKRRAVSYVGGGGEYIPDNGDILGGVGRKLIPQIPCEQFKKLQTYNPWVFFLLKVQEQIVVHRSNIYL